MGVRLIHDVVASTDAVAMYDSVTGWAFGPVFDTVDDAEAFLEWLDDDARGYSQTALEELHRKWVDGRNVEPTDDEIYHPAVHVPDARDEHDRTL